MSPDLAIVVAIFIIIASLFAVGTIYSTRKEREQLEELRRASSARGWTFTTAKERGYRIRRWTGTTEGIAWTAESLLLASGGNKQRRRRRIARWHGVYSPGINGAIVAMGVPKGKEDVGPLAEGEGWFAKMAQTAAGFAFDKAIDVYFGHEAGQEVDAGAMRHVNVRIPGFIVMASDTAEGARVMHEGLETTLINATNDKNSLLSSEDRPWLLLRPRAISLARMEQLKDINELDAFVRAGVALTRSFKFGRPA